MTAPCRYLSSLPLSIFSLSGLRRLDLSCNSLEILAFGVSQFPCLDYLDLSFNKLSTLAPEIGGLKLSTLVASYNRIATLPAQLFNSSTGLCATLETLHLNDNELERVPASLGQCACLRDLKLNYNKITSLPLSLSQLERLASIDLEGNLLRPIELMSLGGDGFSLARFTELLALSCPPPPPPSLPLPPLVGKSGGSFTVPKSPNQRPATEAEADVLILDAQDDDDGVGLQERSEIDHHEETSDYLKETTWSDLSEQHLKPPRSKETQDQNEEEERNRSQIAADLEQVASLPPAAAAVMYRTLEALRGGAREVREGRPISRGCGSLAPGLPPPPPSSSGGRPGSSRPGTALGTFSSTLTRSGLSSSSQQRTNRPLTSTAGSAAASTSSSPHPVSGPTAEKRRISADSEVSAISFPLASGPLPPSLWAIPVPLASGLRSMMRRQSQKMDSFQDVPPKEGEKSLITDLQGDGSVRDSIDLVRAMILNRNPKLLEAFDDSMAEAAQGESVGDHDKEGEET